MVKPLRPGELDYSKSTVEAFVEDVNYWITATKLKLNSGKHTGLIRDAEGHDFCLRKISKMAVKYSKWPSWLFPDFQIII